jgi:hypothetical protein
LFFLFPASPIRFRRSGILGTLAHFRQFFL